MSKADAACWDEAPKGNVHDVLLRVFRHVEQENRAQREADSYHASLYCGSPQAAEVNPTQSRAGYHYGPATLPYNICRSAVDTLVAKIAKQRPLPEALTTRADWAKQKRAKKLTQLIDGKFYQCRLFEKWAKRIVRDAAVLGRGVLKVYEEHGDVAMERVYPWELYTDRWDARYGSPRNKYHCRQMDFGVLKRRFPKLKDAQVGKNIIDRDELQAGTSTVNRIDVLEAWHLPSAPGAKDGRHVIAVSGMTLVDEPWTDDHFPFADLYYSDPFTGDKGQGLVEQLEGYQHDLNLMASMVSQSYRMLGGSIILVPDTAKISKQEFRSGIGTILQHAAGGKPDVFQPNPINPAVYNRQRDLRDDALADSGISQMSAMSQKPAGVTAAVALQTLDDVETERFIIFGRAYESWCLDVARLVLGCVKRIAKREGDMTVEVMTGGTGKSLIEVKWSEAEIEDFNLRVFPTSLLPQQLPQRLERLMQLFEGQLIDRATFMRQLDAPDLAAEMDLETADKMLIDEQLEYLLDAEEGDERLEHVGPTPMVDLNWAIKRAQQKLNRAELDGAPEEVLQRLRDYMATAKDILNPEPTEPKAPVADPMGMPAAPVDPMMDPAMAGAAPMPVDPNMPPMDVPQPGAPMPQLPPGMPPVGPGM